MIIRNSIVVIIIVNVIRYTIIIIICINIIRYAIIVGIRNLIIVIINVIWYSLHKLNNRFSNFWCHFDDNDQVPDSDYDGIPDNIDTDDDNDGVPDDIDNDDDNNGVPDDHESSLITVKSRAVACLG